jgi:sodium-coupled neutral amino acid transporter 11
MAVPLENYVCREVIDDTFFPNKPFSNRRHVITTTLIVFGSMGSEHYRLHLRF